ncbi:MAG: hypothetical protein NVSMB3_01450 [Acidobacteriaceae bacterium]
MNVKLTFLTLAALGCMAATGCRIDSKKQGDSDNVKIATPFGGLQVKTNNADVLSGIGLPDYPGAVLIRKDKDNGSADINMSFGNFQLRVKATSYRTDDSPEKVQAFYRSALGRFGDVIQCSNDHPVGTPVHTAQGLTCDKDKRAHANVDVDFSKKLELKAGSPQHQHIVAIEQEGNGTKFGLVALDLPGHISVGDKQESSQ